MSSVFDELASYINAMLNGMDLIPAFEDERGKVRPRSPAWLSTEHHEERQTMAFGAAKVGKPSMGKAPSPSRALMPEEQLSAPPAPGAASPMSAKSGGPSVKPATVKYARTGVSYAIAAQSQQPTPAAPGVQAARPLVTGVLRPSIGETDPMAVFARIAAMGIADDEEEHRRRGGGGSASGDQNAASHKRAVGSASSYAWPSAAQGLAARAAIAAGAQPAVFKVISTASSSASAGALLQYLGTREGEDGKKHDIDIFTHTGETISAREERRALLDAWKEDFREPFQTTNFIEVTFTVAADLSREDLHEGLNAAFGEKPFAYARDGETVKVFAYTDMKASALAKSLRDGGRGGLQRSEAALASRMGEAGVSASASITGAVSNDRQAQYFLQKFIRANPNLIKADGDDLNVSKRADKVSAELYASWKSDFKTIEPRNVYHVLFSARAGTDAKAMIEAAKNMLSEQIPDHKWVLAHHPETGHTHVHAMILARSELGGQLRFTKPELYEWRDRFAEKAREQGIAMVATSRMDLAATRPFTARQAGAYERSKRDTRYALTTNIAQRVETKRTAQIEPMTVVANGSAIAAGWWASAQALQSAVPGSQAVQSAEGFSATIIDMAGRSRENPNTQRPQPKPAPTLPGMEAQSGMFADMMKDISNMALTPTEYRQKIVNINKSFDTMIGTLPDPKDKEVLENVRAEFNEFMKERLDEIRVQRAEEVTAAGAAARAQSRSLREKAEQIKTQDRAHEIAPAKTEKPQEAARNTAERQKNADQEKASEDQNRKTQRSRDDDFER